MAQNQNIGLLGQYLTVNSAANTVFIAVSNIAYTNTSGTSVGVAYQFINTISGSLDTVFS